MDGSVVIARILGPVLLVLGLAILAEPERFRRLAREFLDGEALLFLSGLLTLTAGLGIVSVHQVWSGWPVVITAFGWLMVAAGIARLTLADLLKAIGPRAIERARLRVPGAIFAASGGWLAWHGWF